MHVRRSLILLVLGMLASSASAAQVLWGSARLATNYLSTGAPATLNSDFTFQLGAFDEGFVPTAANTASWLSHWNPAQSAHYNEKTRFFTGSYVYQRSVGPFAAGNQGYIFGFNRWAASEGSSNVEWILATDPSWRWQAGGGISPPVQWSMSNASQIVLGKVDAPGSAAHMQTAALAAPVDSLTLDLWSKRYAIGSAEAALAGDLDHDGLSNMLEYALSTDPRTPNSGRLPRISFVSEAGQQFAEMTFFKNRLKSGVTLSPEVSNDLIQWSPAGDHFDIMENSTFVYRVRSKAPVDPGNLHFYRIAAEIPR